MTNQQRIVVALVFVVAVVGGGLPAVALTGGGAGASPSPTAQAGASPSATSSASAAPSASAAASPSDTPTEPATGPPSEAPPPTAAPTPAPSPTVAPGVPTTVVVTGFKLDAAADASGADRHLFFRSQGAGEITVSMRLLSPQGGVDMCLYASGDQLGCPADGSITATTTKRREDFEVELRGQGIDTPEVEVSLTFPARNPTLGIENARFDGTAFPETNGIQVLVAPRAAGEVTLVATWGGHPFGYEVDLLQVDGPGTQVLPDQGPSTGVDVALPVTPGTWRLVLQNIDEGFGVTPMDAEIGWP